MKENIIKDRLKSLREEKSIYQKDLADKLHISRAAIADKLHISRAAIASYETGKSLPSLEIVLKYADYFKCSTDYILGRVDKRNFQEYEDVVIKEAAIELLEKTINELKSKI